MRILLDECVPRRLRQHLPGHDVATVTAVGWNGTKNGALLRRAEEAFDVFITTDRNMEFQRPLHRTHIAVIVLIARSNTNARLIPLMPSALAALVTIKPGEIIRISSP